MSTEAAYLAEACRLLVLVVLAFAAATKSVDLPRFATSLKDDFRVHDALGMPLAIVIVGSEWLAAALVLAGGDWARFGAALALLLFATFSAIIAGAVIRKRQTFCSCFGRARHPLSALDLVRNAFYLLACTYFLFRAPTSIAAGAMAQLALLMVALLCFLVSINLNQIRHLLR
jgi:hypothetical protein